MENKDTKHSQIVIPGDNTLSADARKKAAEIVKRCGIRDGLFKGPRTLNAVETITYELGAAREAERERIIHWLERKNKLASEGEVSIPRDFAAVIRATPQREGGSVSQNGEKHGAVSALPESSSANSASVPDDYERGYLAGFKDGTKGLADDVIARLPAVFRADLAGDQGEGANAEVRKLLERALREGRHGPMCDRARCVCWKADARARLRALPPPPPAIQGEGDKENLVR